MRRYYVPCNPGFCRGSQKPTGRYCEVRRAPEDSRAEHSLLADRIAPAPEASRIGLLVFPQRRSLALYQ